MKCDICPSQARERSRYCALCADHVMSVPEGRARVAALKRARRQNGFHCECSGALLSLTDQLGVELDLFDWQSPYYLWSDHLTPGKKGEIAVSSRLANENKTDLDEEEYHAFFGQLDIAFRGGTFDRSAFTTKYWKQPKYLTRWKRPKP